MTKAKPRFIAGAVCPSCRLVDRLVVDAVPGANRVQRRCVACGYSDEQAAAAQHMPTPRFGRRGDDSAATPVTVRDD